jgi:hypothetical protein
MNIPDIDWEENTITGNQYKKVINEVLKSTNQKQELPVEAMFVNGLELNEQSL